MLLGLWQCIDMKTKYGLADVLRSWSRVAVVVGLTLGLNAVAQDAEAPAAKDPFTKEDKAQTGKTKAGAAAADEATAVEEFKQIAQVVEFIEAPHAEVRKWLKANPGAPDGDALRAEVQKWIEAGSAEVLASQMSIARSGQRAKVQSIRELIYPTEFEPIPWRPSAPFSSAFETRWLGMTLEFEPVLLEGVIHLNMAPEWIERVGESQHRPEPKGTVQEGDVRVPLIHTNRVTTQTESDPEKWVLADVQSARSMDSKPYAAVLNPERSVLVFSRTSIQASEGGGADVGHFGDFPGYAKLEWIDVEQATATRWLQRDDLGQWISGGEGARAATEELVEKGEAELAFTRLIPFRSGQRARSETIREVIYATAFEASEQNALSTPRGFETRNTGITVELDAVFSKSGRVVDLNFAPEIVDLVGHSVSQRYFDLETQEWKPDVVMPIFYTTRLTTQLALIIDQPLLAGIMMPHDENGQPDKNKRRLLFVTATK